MGSRCKSPAWRKVPQQELAALDRRLEAEPINIKHLLWLSGGFSGSPVALIRMQRMGAAPAEAILKFCKGGADEVQGIFSAYDNALAEFSRAHMVRPNRDFPLHEWTAVLLEVAGGDLSSYKSIAEFADKQELADICAVVIRSLLSEWNAGSIPASNDMGVGEFLEKVIGTNRLAGTSKLAAFASDSQISWREQWIKQGNPPDWPLNPLALTSSTGEVNALIGYGHGDLNVHNVLVPTEPELNADGFLLIDYGTFSYEYPLARDPMYLLVSLATQWLKDITLPSRKSRALAMELARTGPQPPDLGLADYRNVIGTIFETSRSWAASQHQGRTWLTQSFLALTGVALTFIGREIPGLETAAVNKWLFDLASVVAKEHLIDYSATDSGWSALASHTAPYDLIQRTEPASRASLAPEAGASPADMSQVSADSAAERPVEGNGAHGDRPDPLATLQEGEIARLREELLAVGWPPERPPHLGGIGRWLVSVGYWTDAADSMLSGIASFTFANGNDSLDRFAQAIDDAQSTFGKIMDRLAADTTTTTKDAATLAAWAEDLWRQVARLLRLSMEVCGLGHVLLAADDHTAATTSSDTRPGPAGIPADPGLGILMTTFDEVRSAVKPVFDRFLHERPSRRAADLLVGRLDDLFKLLDRTYLPQMEGGQRVNLERIRKAARHGALGLSSLIESAPSHNELSTIHEELSGLLRVLDDILPSEELPVGRWRSAAMDSSGEHGSGRYHRARICLRH